MRNKKVYIPIVFGLVLLAIGYIALRSDVPTEPIKIYKATTPLPKQTDIRDTTPSIPNSDVQAESTPTTETETSEVSGIKPVDLSQPFFGDESPLAEDFSEDQTDYGVSPFGYGKYPSIPADYPWTPIWALSDEDRLHYSNNDSEMQRKLELMGRVGIKVWESERKDFRGISFSNGRVYLNFPDTVYVRVRESENSTLVTVTGSPISQEDMEDIRLELTPPGIHILDMSEGIEPISFLGL